MKNLFIILVYTFFKFKMIFGSNILIKLHGNNRNNLPNEYLHSQLTKTYLLFKYQTRHIILHV